MVIGYYNLLILTTNFYKRCWNFSIYRTFRVSSGNLASIFSTTIVHRVQKKDNSKYGSESQQYSKFYDLQSQQSTTPMAD